ncbi:MAG TPA: class I SAM-dependent methyltransferase [Steroidobacteraceae bacterium]|nr:class I SAM-dependent methyltransferase [Steroidobacteraceae bacterium]
MNPISDTAYYCCGIRMLDARQRRSMCSDIYAERFMDQRGCEILQRFGAELRPNITNVARHRYIDDEVRRRLTTNRSLRVILIGCGFDSRAFRLQGGEWIELDEPPLITLKNEKLPAQECSNQLVRIPIEFATEPLETKLASFADDRPTLVVLEGVTMYLPSVAIERTLRALRTLFPTHEVIADLMTRAFAEEYGKSIKDIIAAMGANLDPLSDPAGPFLRTGYREAHSESIVCAGFSYMRRGWLRPLMKLVSPRAVTGYTIRTFV